MWSLQLHVPMCIVVLALEKHWRVKDAKSVERCGLPCDDMNLLQTGAADTC